MHPLLQLIATQPRLLGEHAQAYAELLAAEGPRIVGAWKRSALLNALALCGGAVATVLAGVALMLWAVTPAIGTGALWALWGVPLLPAGLALACAVGARTGGEGEAVRHLQDQFAADLLLLREVAAA